MGNIAVLPQSVADLIAAGEVVERPASIVKELTENAIDAGADKITIEFKKGGSPYIRVTDNGRGMGEDDVKLCVQRHATSKIKSSDDLAAVSTLGFRGEALCTIAAVSRMDIITCERGAATGTHGLFEGGALSFIESAGCPEGTTIIVRDVFYNTPARMKFLKKDGTEGGAIVDMAQKLALSRPDVSITLIRDEEVLFSTPGGDDMPGTIYNILGAESFKGMLSLNYSYSGINVAGYASRPENARFNRGGQYFFLNGRYIKSRLIGAAFEEAYRDQIMTRRFAAGVVYVTISPEACDINVHPAKTEVKFFSEKSIYDAVYFAVKTALQKDTSRPSLTPTIKRPVFVESPHGPAGVEIRPGAISALNREAKEGEAAHFGRETPPPPAIPLPVSAETVALHYPINEGDRSHLIVGAGLPYYERDITPPYFAVLPSEEPVGKMEDTETKVALPLIHPAETCEAAKMEGQAASQSSIIGEVFSTYIAVELEDELLLVDKHAAHERIIYEKLRSSGGPKESQLLLDPVVVNLRPDELACLFEHRELLSRAGFEIEEFGNNSLIVREVPFGLDRADITELIYEIADRLKSGGREVRTSLEDHIFHTVACKAAVKAGKKSGPEQIKALIDELTRSGAIRYCPHGRPVSAVLSRADIEKQFGRRG